MISNQYISRISLNRDKVESFDLYPFSIPAIHSFDFIDPHPKVTFFYWRERQREIHIAGSDCRRHGI
ncbi:hypothetical protein [Dickeya oryzae]